MVVRNAGDDTINHFGSYEPVVGPNGVHHWTAPIRLWRFAGSTTGSEEGIMYMTYGIEDYTYTVADDGTVTFTDMIVNNTDGMSPEGMIRSTTARARSAAS